MFKKIWIVLGVHLPISPIHQPVPRPDGFHDFRRCIYPLVVKLSNTEDSPRCVQWDALPSYLRFRDFHWFSFTMVMMTPKKLKFFSRAPSGFESQDSSMEGLVTLGPIVGIDTTRPQTTRPSHWLTMSKTLKKWLQANARFPEHQNSSWISKRFWMFIDINMFMTSMTNTHVHEFLRSARLWKPNMSWNQSYIS